MKKQLMIIGIILLLLTVGLSGCNENTYKLDEEKIIGTWTYKEPYEGKFITGSFTFLSNKTCEYYSSYEGNNTNLIGSWNFSDNKLELKFEGTTTEKVDYKFSNHYMTLTLTDETGYHRYLRKQ